METSEASPHRILQFFKHIEPGTPVRRTHLFAFLGLLCVYSLLVSFAAPVQSSKIGFLVITVQFFLNFFYAFHCKIELETIKNHHYSIVACFCVGAFCVFGVQPGAWFFLLLNVPFLGGLVKEFLNSSQKLWTLMLFGLNMIVLVLFYFYTAAGEESREWLFSKKYFGYSLIILCAALLWAYEGFNNTSENVHHLSNLVNFIFIAFLPFLFVLQKDEAIPMHNVLGYICLIPTVLCGVLILSLSYFFVANFKSQNTLSLVNLCSMFYLFVHHNIYSSMIIQLLFLIIIALMFANIPLKINTFFIDSFDEIDANEDLVENGKSYGMHESPKQSRCV